MITTRILCLSLSLLLLSETMASPIEYTHQDGMNHTLNGQPITLVFENSAEHEESVLIKSPLKQQWFTLNFLPERSQRSVYFKDYNFDGFLDILVSVYFAGSKDLGPLRLGLKSWT